MSPQNAALADLAEAVGRALVRFAEQTRGDTDEALGDGPAGHTQTAPTPPTRVARTGLGSAQAAALTALESAGEKGMTAREVAEAAGLQSSNASVALGKLVGYGLAEVVAEGPFVWRVVDLPGASP